MVMHGRRWIALVFMAAMVAALGCTSPEDQPTKKPTPEPAGMGSKCGITVKLYASGDPECGDVKPDKITVSKSMDDGNIRWRNQTTSNQTIIFTEDEWIFDEPWPADGITIAPHGQTDWFHVKDDAAEGIPHPYHVSPLVDGCPPQEPAITADP